jgi:hypothetical protein
VWEGPQPMYTVIYDEQTETLETRAAAVARARELSVGHQRQVEIVDEKQKEQFVYRGGILDKYTYETRPPRPAGRDDRPPREDRPAPAAAETAPDAAETAPDAAETAPDAAETAPDAAETAPDAAETKSTPDA